MAETRTGTPTRRGTAFGALALCLASLVAPTVQAADPVKHIAIYVDPFYRAGRTPEEAPQVSTGAPHAPLLASLKPEDIVAARDLVDKNPALVTPMTMMVLAIRLYDEDRQLIAQSDGPINETPTRAWAPTYLYPQSAALPIPANLAPGLYSLEMVLYRQDSAEALPLDTSGEQVWRLKYVAVEN